jgi:hypothetical protein
VTKQEISSGLETGQNDLVTFFNGLSDEVFFSGSDERWSPAHHLAHLTFTHKRVAQGFKAKGRLQDCAEKSKSYEEIKANYLAALQRAASAGFLRNNPFAAKPETDNKESVIAAFMEEALGLREAVSHWSEEDLDAKAIPHPLLGNLSAREMLLFMMYHDQHHLRGVQSLTNLSARFPSQA